MRTLSSIVTVEFVMVDIEEEDADTFVLVVESFVAQIWCIKDMDEDSENDEWGCVENWGVTSACEPHVLPLVATW